MHLVLAPKELVKMIKLIRLTELILGSEKKKVSKSEKKEHFYSKKISFCF